VVAEFRGSDRFPARMRDSRGGAGLANAMHGGYRYQLIYRTTDHFDHVHLGVKDV
jgi:hypothetical protein